MLSGTLKSNTGSISVALLKASPVLIRGLSASMMRTTTVNRTPIMTAILAIAALKPRLSLTEPQLLRDLRGLGALLMMAVRQSTQETSTSSPVCLTPILLPVGSVSRLLTPRTYTAKWS